MQPNPDAVGPNRGISLTQEYAPIGWLCLVCDLFGFDEKLWFVFFLIAMAVLVVLSVIRIKMTTRLQLVIGAATVAVILVVAVVVTIAKGNTLAPFSFGHTTSGGFNGVFYGIIFGSRRSAPVTAWT